MAKSKTSSTSIARFATEFGSLFEDRVDRELHWAGDRNAVALLSSVHKKNYAETLSRALAQRFADALRGSFEGILPDTEGHGQELRARTGKGSKKLDVNYSTVELGLGLGVSIKTINFRDARTNRYTKNYTRVDNELRAEAADYHERQPYAVLCAVVYLPLDACDDGGRLAPSSFGQAIRIFRHRAGREKSTDDPTLFERILVGLYEVDAHDFGKVAFFDVMDDPPRTGRPKSPKSFRDAVRTITDAYDGRNKTKFKWAEGDEEIITSPEPEEEIKKTSKGPSPNDPPVEFRHFLPDSQSPCYASAFEKSARAAESEAGMTAGMERGSVAAPEATAEGHRPGGPHASNREVILQHDQVDGRDKGRRDARLSTGYAPTMTIGAGRRPGGERGPNGRGVAPRGGDSRKCRRNPLKRLTSRKEFDLEFVPKNLVFVPSDLDFVPPDLESVPEALDSVPTSGRVRPRACEATLNRAASL